MHFIQRNNRGRINISYTSLITSYNLNVWLYQAYIPNGPVTVAVQSKACTVFISSNAGIVGSNPTQGMDVCVCVYSVFVVCM
jgi:hypothetical protein